MKPGTVYHLEKEGVLLGKLVVTDSEMFAVHCTFEATQDFEPYRVLFDEDAEVSDLMDQEETPELLDRLIDVTDRIQILGLIIRREGGGVYRQAILHIAGNKADFRPIDPHEEPL